MDILDIILNIQMIVNYGRDSTQESITKQFDCKKTYAKMIRVFIRELMSAMDSESEWQISWYIGWVCQYCICFLMVLLLNTFHLKVHWHKDVYQVHYFLKL